MTEIPQEADSRGQRQQVPEPTVPPVNAVLGFLGDDLAAIVERLSQYATDLGSGRLVHASHGAKASILGLRIARLALILRSQKAEDWVQAARWLKGKHGKQGWSQTCWNIGMSESAIRGASLVADRLDEAGSALQLCEPECTPATLAHHARAAAQALVCAATEWNTLMRWKKSPDRSAQESDKYSIPE